MARPQYVRDPIQEVLSLGGEVGVIGWETSTDDGTTWTNITNTTNTQSYSNIWQSLHGIEQRFKVELAAMLTVILRLLL